MMYLCCPLALHDIFHSPVARSGLFTLKVPFNTDQLVTNFAGPASIECDGGDSDGHNDDVNGCDGNDVMMI